MNNIKIRVWDKYIKNFLTFSSEDNMFYNLGVPYNLSEIFSYNKKHEDNRFTVNQFTGLFDLNNSEIYEGDILKFTGYTFEFSDIFPITLEVKWEDELGVWIGYHPIHKNILGYFNRESKIIGNIHESKF